MDTVTLTDLRKRFEEVLAQVEQGKSFTVTKHGKPVAVLVTVPVSGDVHAV